jgi:hypothetical protein
LPQLQGEKESPEQFLSGGDFLSTVIDLKEEFHRRMLGKVERLLTEREEVRRRAEGLQQEIDDWCSRNCEEWVRDRKVCLNCEILELWTQLEEVKG